MNNGYLQLIRSTRVSRGTRAALEARARPDDPTYAPTAMSGDALRTLRAVLDRVIPQAGPQPIDLAARIDAQLAAGVGDGWRVADLPSDAMAYRAGLNTLCEAARAQCGETFDALEAGRQDALLVSMAAGRLGTAGNSSASDARLTAPQMRLWFEDVRAAAVRCFVAHPDTLARLGYSGIANGGDGEPKSGFVRVGVNEKEEWEPTAFVDAKP